MVTRQCVTSCAQETHALGFRLGQQAQPGDVIACYGTLGAGKTTFVQGFAAGVGVGQAEYVRSPTFTLVHEYKGRFPLYHFDFYRLDSCEDVYSLAFDDYLATAGAVIIEWADKFPMIVPSTRLDVAIEVVSAERRALQWTARHPSYVRYVDVTV